jgi:predicted transcriptional regulator
MSKKNLPHIPIYIGDWEKDCNALSLESEMAWMKIIFKMWNNGKQSVYKIPTKSLQILWKSPPQKVSEIIEELRYNDIGLITMDNGIISFLCRRFEKENSLSEIRSKAVSKRKDRIKPLQKVYKSEQNADNDNDNDNDNDYDINIEGKGGMGEKPNGFPELTLVELYDAIETETTWKETICRNFKAVQKDFTMRSVDDYLEQFFKLLENDADDEKSLKDFKKHFSRWLTIEINKKLKNTKNGKQFTGNQSDRAKQAVSQMFGG